MSATETSTPTTEAPTRKRFDIDVDDRGLSWPIMDYVENDITTGAVIVVGTRFKLAEEVSSVARRRITAKYSVAVLIARETFIEFGPARVNYDSFYRAHEAARTYIHSLLNGDDLPPPVEEFASWVRSELPCVGRSASGVFEVVHFK